MGYEQGVAGTSRGEGVKVKESVLFSPQRAEDGMPWRETSVMDRRMRFLVRLTDGESMVSQCRESGI